MPIFQTPQPIAVTVELGVGNLRITASDRADTAVEVRPTDDSDESDVKAANQIRVEYGNGVLLVSGPRIKPFGLSRKTRSATVSIELPAGSRLDGNVQMGDLHVTGELAECAFKTSTGHVQLDRTGPARLHTAAGHVTVGLVAGNAEISTGTGKVRVGEIHGTADIKNSNGNTDLGSVAGDTKARCANGDITIERTVANVDAKTSNGSLTIREAVRGSVGLKTANGDITVGIAEGTAAWLDVHTTYGRLRNTLEQKTTEPEPAADRVEVRANTSFGDIQIRRA
ncbi:DUF4097 family beta strand repeat-containing protein [Amycolatopsis sp.]|uniref:DUF4097 family beta strand repeat-containing protein n=1 Tax=Amycolatopsis sp. TaxID=37632 RepID=UPI002CB5550C|nr:DUF4097 family beta strand repeat-containing protein [Amycolatopsis sp.]HVV08444.1 DUF4097 family beta strand repeat-containing protein [Amycolatopsis sp.]